MQQKVNSVVVKSEPENTTFEDVQILKGAEGLYIETIEKIGTDTEGKDLMQTRLTMYPWETIVSLSWTEPTLIEQTKQTIILEALQDIEGFLEDYESEDEEEEDESTDARDNPKVNPYE